MKQKTHKLLCLLLTGALLLTLISPAALAADSLDTLYLRTAEDLSDLAQQCTLDSWSQGKTVYLEEDIDLSGVDFTPIPTFGGVFEGQGHTISGLSITGSGNVRGLFRYIQPTGAVRDLTVTGSLAPSDRENTLGGLAGSNQGTLTNCSFIGTISGTDSIGGLVGINEAQGQIINCTFSGSVTGEHYVGGIAGENFGSIIQCENSGSINTTIVDPQLDLDTLNRQQLNAVENAPVCTDIGGIAGFSAGILQSCSNMGAVGYAHVGYNIGGIVGRQSGYLDGCDNSGIILGRKDVGGIAGQLEPEVQLLYDEGKMGSLLDELDVLRGIIDRTGDNLRDSSDELSRRMKAVSDRAGEAQEAVSDLADSTTDWANDNIDEIDDLTSRISWFIDEMTSILEEVDDVIDLVKKLADQLHNIIVPGQNAENWGSDTAEEIQSIAEELRSSANDSQDALDAFKTAMNRLRDGLGKSEQTADALEDVAEAADQLIDSLSSMADKASQTLEIFPEIYGEDMNQEDIDSLQDALARIRTGLDAMKPAALDMGEAAGEWVLSSREQDSSGRQKTLDAGERVSSALRTVADAAASGEDAASRQAERSGNFLEELKDIAETIQEISSLTSNISKDIYDMFQELSDQPTIHIRPISKRIQRKGDDLEDAFTDLLDDGDALREAMSDATDVLLDDLEAINDQFGVITDRFRDLMEGSDEKLEDRFEDVSDQETETTDTGAITNARNSGSVQGDINVAGIVGSMAIEYDFDPEDDLIQEGDRSLDFRYQAHAVVDSCVNTGEITGKQDYSGGIVGLMDLGRVSGCENYGSIASDNGDYVGGIAGGSWGSIRDCWSKCHLSGGDYVGGVAGLGATLVNCRTLVSIDEGSAFLGAVAGDVDADGTVSGNIFTHDVLGALDGISYAGKAEPVDFDTLCAASGAPEQFSQLELTFTADGNTVAVVPFQYGEGIDTLPAIPAKKGYSASWPEIDYNCLTASQTLEAKYTPYTSALTDGGELPQILVDGSFGSRASVTHTTEEVTWTDTRPHSGVAYTVAVDDPDLEKVSYTVHYRLPDSSKRYDLWILGEEGWFQAEYEIDGQYLLLDSQTEEITFCVTERPTSLFIWVTAASGAVIVLAAGSRIRRHRRKQDKIQDENAENKAEV